MATGLHIRYKKEHHIGQWIFWIVLIGLLAGCGYAAYHYYNTGQMIVPVPVANANVAVDETPVDKTKIDEHKVEPNQPRYLSINTLNIHNARVFGMGVKPNNELDTPVNINDVGWYQKSALPGSGRGALLIDGHNGGPTKDGVFKKAPRLAQGDTITIERGDGKRISYTIKQVKTYTLDDLNQHMNEMTSSIDSGTEGLNLISCTGNWVPKLQTYDQRVVVRAVAQ